MKREVKGLTMTVTFNADDVRDMAKKLAEEGKLAPVVHGVLEEKTGRYGEQYFVCSKCGAEIVYEDSNRRPEWYNFCPKCGAKMDKEEPDG